MKLRQTSLILAEIIMLGAYAGAARAEDDRQVWRDSDGVVIENSWGNCVRSRWSISHDPCGVYAPPPVPVVMHWPQARTSIMQEARTVYFGFNKADLTEDSKSKLNALADQLTSADDVQGAKVVGYADRIGTRSYNEKLSKKRADVVRDYLVGRGFVKPSETQVQWVGKSEPSASCSNKLPHAQLVECLQPDRKVTVELVYQQVTSE